MPSADWPGTVDVPVGYPYGYAELPSPQNQANPNTPFTQQEVEAWRQRFQETLIQSVMMAIQGFITPGLGSDQLSDWVTNTVDDAWDTAHDWLDGFWNAITGQALTGITTGQAAERAAEIAQTLAANAAMIAELQADADQGTFNGVAGLDTFNYTDTDLDTGDWSKTVVTGTDYGHYVPNGTEAVWAASSSADCEVRYRRINSDDAVTVTNYQKIVVIVGSTIGWTAGASTDPYFSVFARLASDDSAYVKWEITGSEVRLLYKNGGSETELDSASMTHGAGTALVFEAGTTSGEVFYRVSKIGRSVVLDYEDTGAVTDPDQYGWGIGGKQFHTVGVYTPSSINQVSVNDNLPPTYPGTGGTMVRTGTGTVNVSSGTNLLPNSFWGSTQDVSADIATNLTTGVFTMNGKPGRFTVTIALKVNDISSGSLSPVLYLNTGSGLTKHRVGADAINALGVVNERATQTFTNICLSTGDSIAAGTTATASTTGALTGESDGIQCFFSICRNN